MVLTISSHDPADSFCSHGPQAICKSSSSCFTFSPRFGCALGVEGLSAQSPTRSSTGCVITSSAVIPGGASAGIHLQAFVDQTYLVRLKPPGRAVHQVVASLELAMTQPPLLPVDRPGHTSSVRFGIYDRGQLAIRGKSSNWRQIMVDVACELWG